MQILDRIGEILQVNVRHQNVSLPKPAWHEHRVGSEAPCRMENLHSSGYVLFFYKQKRNYLETMNLVWQLLCIISPGNRLLQGLYFLVCNASWHLSAALSTNAASYSCIQGTFQTAGGVLVCILPNYAILGGLCRVGYVRGTTHFTAAVTCAIVKGHIAGSFKGF